MSLMFQEAAEAATAIRKAKGAWRGPMEEVAKALVTRAPSFLATVARGSSDNAATFAKYLVETRVGVPTFSQAPSIASLFDATSPRMRNGALIAISQSGRSEDLLKTFSAAKKAGALAIAMVNDEASPLAAMADHLLPLLAGPELSVAATKSFIASLGSILALVAAWTQAADLDEAVSELPAALTRAWNQDWSHALPHLSETSGLYVLGRGLTFSVAQEMALKFKETCGIHAEAFSAAEVSHGPSTLIGRMFPVFFVPPSGIATSGMREQIAEFQNRGALTIVVGDGFGGDIILPIEKNLPAELLPIVAIQSFYRLVDTVAVARGRDPDNPPFLKKITHTL